jgi:hypothetical protein
MSDLVFGAPLRTSAILATAIVQRPPESRIVAGDQALHEARTATPQICAERHSAREQRR